MCFYLYSLNDVKFDRLWIFAEKETMNLYAQLILCSDLDLFENFEGTD